MAYLDNTTMTIEAVLTKKGRELLASGQQNFKITQFAVGDDEIDYTLWNPTHPLGSNYYGEVIEQLPLLEAFTDETQALKSKLITLPKQSQFIPVVAIEPNVSSITLTRVGEKYVITPKTLNIQNGNETLGYTIVLGDSTAVDVNVLTSTQNTTATSTVYYGDSVSRRSITLTGKEFELVAKPQQFSTSTTTITITGNETGGSVVIPITVRQLSVDVISLTQGS